MKKLFFLFVLLFSLNFAAPVFAQNAISSEKVEMADAFRKEGKIYVVVGTFVLILTGIIVYLVVLDRKLTKLEDEIEHQK
ncbi:MAG: CcmD family protein [Sporocytophaga sp.]|uniref:CcmD family protein n=1 Tax=Sporocytophaga sp. TaxID=2231183 RepID=UPI001B179028|nr:CcmD family protein [Sporocytophaga sp.]MBO9702281.1 CcmD family protein [Sporocytophaga sp.]